MLYVTNRNAGTISLIDFATNTVTRTWVIPGGGSPDMGGVSADGKVFWVSGRYNGVVYAIDTTTGALLHKIRVGFGPARPLRLPAARAVLARPHRRLPLVAASRHARGRGARSRSLAVCVQQCAADPGIASTSTTVRDRLPRPDDHARRTPRPPPTTSARRPRRLDPAASNRRSRSRSRRRRRRRTGDRSCTSSAATTRQRNSSATVFVFDGSTWRRGPALPIAVNHPGAAAIGGDVYVAGGFTPDGATNRASSCSRPARSSWRELAPMHAARGALALARVRRTLVRDRRARPLGADRAAREPTTRAARRGRDLAGDARAAESRRRLRRRRARVCRGRSHSRHERGGRLSRSRDARRGHIARDVADPTSGAAAAVIDGVTIVAGGEPAGETSIVGVVQSCATAHGPVADARAAPRHRVRDVPRPALWPCGGATAPGFQAVATCTSLGT